MKPGDGALILLLESFKYDIRQWGKGLLSGLSLSTKTFFSEFVSLLISIHIWFYNIIFRKKKTRNKQGKREIAIGVFHKPTSHPPSP